MKKSRLAGVLITLAMVMALVPLCTRAAYATVYSETNNNIDWNGQENVFYVDGTQEYYVYTNGMNDYIHYYYDENSWALIKKWRITIDKNGHMTLTGWARDSYVYEADGHTPTQPDRFVSADLGSSYNAWKIKHDLGGMNIVRWKLADTSFVPTDNRKIQYDGNEHELVGGIGDSGQRHYSFKRESGDWSEWSTDVPKASAVGTYTIRWYSDISDRYLPRGSTNEPAGTFNAKIVSAAATAPTLEGWSGTYDGNEHTITQNGAQGGTVYYRTSTDGEHWSKWSKTVPSRTEAGATYVEAYTRGDEDHVDSEVAKAAQINISKADPIATAPSAAAVYGQTLADIALSNPAGNTTGVWTWNDKTQTVGSVGSHTYKATFTPVDTDNYNVMTNIDVNVNVGKANNPAKVRETAKVTKGGKAVDLSENISKGGASGAVSYEISGDALGCSIDESGKLISGDSAGTVIVNVSIAADENYEALAETQITVTVTDKNLQTITAEAVAAAYGDKDKSVSAEVSDPATGGGEISYAVKSGSEDYLDVDSATGRLTIKKVPANGKAYVTATAAETEDFEQETKDVRVNISKADTVSALVTANDRVANGREKPLVNIEDEKLVRGTMYYALGRDAAAAPESSAYSKEVPKASESGIYYVWYKVEGDENHNDVDPACVTVTVSDGEETPDTSGVLTYLISSEDDWNRFAAEVNKGKSFKGINVRMTDDITVSTMAGTDANRFKGTFDGDGHTLAFNCNTDEAYAAPFRYVESARFCNLKVSGTIKTSKQFAAGFVGDSCGNTSFVSCHSNITIVSSAQGDGTHGGFVARADKASPATSTSFTDCLFDGNITGRNTENCGGFVGWPHNNTVDLKNCMNAGEYTTKASGCGTFSRGTGAVLQNCYYYNVYGTAQGSQTYATGNLLKGLLGDGWKVSGDEVIPKKVMVGALQGEGTVEDPYLIQEDDDWINFVQRVNNGNNFAGKRILLTKDISVTVMAGTDANRFGGTFDGNGHTITVNLNVGEDYAAPFRFVRGAKFYNLKVTGTIETSKKFAAGFVGKSSDNTSFTSCHSNVTIGSSVNGDGTHGGFVAIAGKIVSFKDCLFDGRIQGGATTNCAGFAAYQDTAGSTASFTNCLNAGIFDTVQEGSGTFLRVRTDCNTMIDNSYYKVAYGAAQGTETDKTGDELKDLLGDGWIVTENNKVIPKTSDVPEELSAVVDYDHVKFRGIEWIVLDADYTNGYTSEEAFEAGGRYSPGILLLSVGSMGKISTADRKRFCTDFYNNKIGDAYKGTILGVKAGDGLNGLGAGAEDKVFFLSEAEFVKYNGMPNYHNRIPRVNYWWLRDGNKCVGNGGYGYDAEVQNLPGFTNHARPAINLDPDKVFFYDNPDYTVGGSEPKLIIDSKEGIVNAAKEELQTAMDKAETARDYVAKGYTAESKQNVTDKVEAGQACLEKDYDYTTLAEAKAARKEILKAKSDVEAAVEDLTAEKYEVPQTDYTIKAGNEIFVDGVDTSVSDAGGRAYTGTPMFRVLKVEDGKMLLMSEYLWAGGKGTTSYDRVMFNNSENNAWQGSRAQDWGAAFNEDILSQIEGLDVANVPASRTDKEYVPAEGQASGSGLSFGESENILTTDDKVFFLSGEEALEFMKNRNDRVAKLYDEDGAGDAAIWWLRSPIKDSSDAGHILDNGTAGARAANKGCYMRPVFWANMPDNVADSISRSSKNIEGTERTVYTIAPVQHEHDWDEVTYEWADDNSTVTATRVCKLNPDHKETETVNTTSEITKEATETAEGERTYTAEFKNNAFAKQTKTENIPQAEHVHALNKTEAKAATCTETGNITYWTCSKCNKLFSDEEGTQEITDADKIVKELGHDYRFTGMTWTKAAEGEGYTVKANFVCRNDGEHKINIDAVVTSEKTDSTCQAAGIITYTAKAILDGIEYTDTKTDGIEVKAHSWGTPEYTWSKDGSVCIAKRSCTNSGCDAVETEMATMTANEKTPATCEKKGTTTYTASFKGTGFEQQTKDVEDIPALGHNWGEVTYKWADDNSSVTATRFCSHNKEHVEKETAETTSKITKEATETEKGERTYTAVFKNAAFAKQTKTADIPIAGHVHALKKTEAKAATCTENGNIAYWTCSKCKKLFSDEAGTHEITNEDTIVKALGHDYRFTGMTWTKAASGEGYTAAANFVCEKDRNHTETVTAEISSETVDSTCQQAGITTYTAKATFDGKEYTDTKTDGIEVKSHSWGDPEYKWSADGSVCVAKRSCTNSGCDAVETEMATVTSGVKTAATCEAKGTTTYTASFENAGFEQQTKDVEDIPALGHNWGEVTYKWADDNSSVTATRFCSHNKEHVEKETAETTSKITKEATETEKGERTYTAVFKNAAFAKQTKTADIPEASHVHALEKTEAKSATCTEDGNIAYWTCSKCSKLFADEAGTQEITETDTIVKALGHDYRFTGMTWTKAASGSGYTAAANFVCEHDRNHTETVTAEISSETVDSTCQQAGITTYTAKTTFDGKEYTDTKTDGIEVKAHSWGNPEYKWSADGSVCVAKRACTNNGCDAEETEMATVTSEVKTPATYEAKGISENTAVFVNEAFATQKKEFDIRKLERDAAAEEAKEKINSLPESGEITIADKAAVERAKAAYNALTEEQKKSIPASAVSKLEAAETALGAAEKKAAEEAEKAAKAAEEARAKAEAAQNAAAEAKAEAEAAQKAADDKAAEEAKAKAEAAQKAAEEARAKAEAAQKAAEEKAAEAEKKAFKPLAQVKLAKVKGARKKATVKWTAVDGAKGYKIVIAKNKKGTKQAKTYTVKGANRVRKVVKKLRKGKYYVRVRAYKTYNGNTVYGKFSKAKRVKVR